jgi:hypothetical protein
MLDDALILAKSIESKKKNKGYEVAKYVEATVASPKRVEEKRTNKRFAALLEEE